MITCGRCGKAHEIEQWAKGQAKETYKCPACQVVIKRTVGPAKVLASGFIIPGKITLTEVAP